MAGTSTDIMALIADLRREHEELDGKLAQMERGRNHLGVAEEAEVKRLKKLKLAKKDRLYALQRSARA
ncbi:MAG TPA: DUF465 domain-containing protein [Myxococcales bacterium]|nr:DUF465 domain-containing protein [Myxococcales bacterium]